MVFSGNLVTSNFRNFSSNRLKKIFQRLLQKFLLQKLFHVFLIKKTSSDFFRKSFENNFRNSIKDSFRNFRTKFLRIPSEIPLGIFPDIYQKNNLKNFHGMLQKFLYEFLKRFMHAFLKECLYRKDSKYFFDKSSRDSFSNFSMNAVKNPPAILSEIMFKIPPGTSL